MKIAIIGAGNIGGAIARGLGSGSIINPSDIYCSDRSQEILDRISRVNGDIRTTADNTVAVRDADIVIVAVKPWFVESVISEIKPFLSYGKQIFVSIAAGVGFARLCEYLKKDGDGIPAIFRIIPNTAIEAKESVNIISAYNATPEQTTMIKNVFDGLGLTVIVEERLMNAGMALASCGIAYAFRYIRAAVEGAVELGLTPELAKKIEMQTLRGAVALLEMNNSHPEAEIDRVTTPGGITIRGLNAMEEAGFTIAVIKGLKASALKDG
ncbi:MAG: pyrroline-5-carboxylate reductase [Tannerella sp.]|jgi:pyrroline-5-carboxylate reductase|nr:pyrroline-5-carboxylate reductase [Tannerella sp.]